MKFEIEPIHLGRYWFKVWDKRTPDGPYEIVWGADGGSAFIMLMLAKYIFTPEHHEYQHDQRVSSDQLAEETLCRFANEGIFQKKLPKR